MLENGKIIKFMEKASKLTKMEAFIKEIIYMVKNKDKELLNGQMELNTKEDLLKELGKDMESIKQLMERFTKEIFFKVKNKEKESS